MREGLSGRWRCFARAHAMIPALAAAILMIGFGAVDQAWAQGGSGEYFYYHQGKQIPLKPSVEYVAFRAAPGHEATEVTRGYAEIDSKGDQAMKLPAGLTLVRVKAATGAVSLRQLFSAMESDASIELVPPVFDAAEGRMIVTDEFVVQFDATMGDDAIKQRNDEQQVETVKKLDVSPSTYMLKVKSGNALEAANRYAQMGGVVYSHPNFVRVMKRQGWRESIKGKPRRKVFGPDGSLLPSDTVLPRGEGGKGYRVVESAQLVLPPTMGAKMSGPRIETELPSSLEKSPQDEMLLSVPPVSKTTIVAEGFEGTSFGTGWATRGNPTWGRSSYRAYEGSWSAYCVGNGTAAPGPYPNMAQAWAIFGPFNLADAVRAQLNLMTWIRTEAQYDFVDVVFSLDGTNYYGYRRSGDWTTLSPDSNGWINASFDLTNIPTLGNLCGKSKVYLAFKFTSDSSFAYEGVYIDRIKLEKITGGLASPTNDPLSSLQWGLSNNGQTFGTAGADAAVPDGWSLSQGSDQITIAVIDEGVDLAHPDLMGKLVAGYDATGGGSAGGPSGNDAHGTNCAGIAAASTDNSAGMAGAARLAKIMPVRIGYTGSEEWWVTTDAWVADGITWAANHGADVLSNSWGGGTPADVLTNAIAGAKQNGRGGKGCVVVFAAGNANSSVIYPGSLDMVLCVGALSPCNERKSPVSCDGEEWWGSNHGVEVDVTAPGVHMPSTDISGSAGYDATNYYIDFNGTSSATPLVSGVAGLTLGACPTLTAAQVENILKTTAVSIGVAGTGSGRVNAAGAVAAALGQCAPTTGALAVSIGPEPAVTAGAQWRVDGGTWQNSEATVTGLSVGSHTVDFKDVTGWTTPENQTVAITAGQTTSAGGTYAPITGVTLSLPQASGAPGSHVLVPVSITDAAGLMAVNVNLTYDPHILSPQNVTLGTLSTGFSLTWNVGSPGVLLMAMAGLPATGGGTLAVVDFLVTGAMGSTCTLGLTQVSLNDGAISATVVNGSFTVSGLYDISGTCSYYNNGRPIRGVALSLTGGQTISQTTAADGTFAFHDVPMGSYLLTPSKSDDVGSAITSMDASYVLQHVVHLMTLNSQQLIAADVNGNGAVTSMDASLILQKVVNLISLPFPVGKIWAFSPTTRSYDPLNADQAGQSFSGILIGDVNGNWTAPAESSAGILNSGSGSVEAAGS